MSPSIKKFRVFLFEEHKVENVFGLLYHQYHEDCNM